MFKYTCVTCERQCFKEPVKKTHSLGKFRCPSHGPTKVQREKVSVKEVAA